MEDNKLIAEFMGFQKTSIGWYDADECLHEKDNTFDTLRFNVDWNWLMPVVEKIERDSLDLFGEYEDTIINGCSCYIYSNSGNISTTETSKFKAVYSAVINYINITNQLNK
jgi:hypothetical protein